MTARLFTALLAGLLLAGPGMAEEGRRFPKEHITVENWSTYLAEVKALPGVILKEDEMQTTITQEKPSLAIYSFTTAKNPAHPGIVVRTLVKSDEGYGITRTGYYAGSVDEFARWWQAFDALDQELKADLAEPSKGPPDDTTPIQVSKSSTGTFLLTIASSKFSNLKDAQTALLHTAVEACQGKRPKLGVYRVEQLQKAGAPKGAPVLLKLDQEIICE